MTPEEVRTELTSTASAITAAGLPRPTLYRPPLGDIDAATDVVARSLGYRVVMPRGTASGNIIDARDWFGDLLSRSPTA